MSVFESKRRSRMPDGKLAMTRAAMAVMLGTLVAMGPGVASAHGGAEGHKGHTVAKAMPANGDAADVKLLDLELVSDEGRAAKFESEVIGERIVVMDFIYTSCTTVCPVLTAMMGSVQRKLGKRAGKDVYLVSLSVDPVTDTPRRLKAYKRRHKARPGWTFYTGQKTAVDKILDGLGVYTPDFIDHPAVLLVGDGRTGEWTRFFGFVNPDQILATVNQLLAARRARHAEARDGEAGVMAQ